MTKIRTAILGYGRNGSTMHADAVATNSAFEMVAACDIDPERRKQAAERFGCAVYEDYAEMLDTEHLDLVIIVTRSNQHCRMTCDCLVAGVHVLVTKPWAVNEAEARSMIAAADKSGRLLLPWLPSRWACDLKRLKQLLDEKVIGNVFMIRRAVSSFGTRCDWQTERQYGGGYLLNWGPHIIDTPIFLVDGKVASVYGWMKQTINPGDVEDNFFALITLDNGVLIRAEYTVAVEDVPNWFIQGDRGTIVVRGQQLKIYKNTPAQPGDPTQFATMKSEQEETIEEQLGGEIYGDTDEIYTAIAEGILGPDPYPVTPQHALELTRILDAIRASSEGNRVVTL